MAVAVAESREIKSNRKIPVPDVVRRILALDWGEKIVAWNYHTEEDVAVLSSRPLAGDDFEEYEFVDRSEFMDDGRYVRPPNALPDRILHDFKREEQDIAPAVAEVFDMDMNEARATFKHPVPGAFPDPQAVFVTYTELIKQDPRIVFLFSDRQFRARLPVTPHQLLQMKRVEH